MAMSILENAGYEHYEISNYARPGFSSVHNRAYWLGEDYLGIGPSAVSTVGTRRWQNVCDYRIYIDRVLSAQSPREPGETLTDEMKRMERIALTLRTRDGVSASDLKHFAPQTNEFIALDLLRESNGNFVLTRKGKALAESVAEAFLYPASRHHQARLQMANRILNRRCIQNHREWHVNGRGCPIRSD